MNSEPRFVNLGQSRTQVLDPDGRQIFVHPFSDALHPRTKKDDAVYVLEGEFWRRYVSEAGPLYPFPRPAAFGRESFPPLVARGSDGRAVDLESGSAVDEGAALSMAPLPGRLRLAGDVLTPDGRIKRQLPDGTIELLEDTPENRTTTEADTHERNPQVRDGVLSWIERMDINSFEEFAALPDETLLRIPGVNAGNLPALRANMSQFLRTRDDLRQPSVTPDGETAATATQAHDQAALEEAAQDPEDAQVQSDIRDKRKRLKRTRPAAKD